MTKIRAGRPYADSRLVKFLDSRIRDLKSRKSQAEIATEAGFNSVNMMAMVKTGATKLPLDRVPALARALECDPAALFKLTVEQQDSALAGVVNQIFGIAVTKNEVAWLEAIREASDHCDQGAEGHSWGFRKMTRKKNRSGALPQASSSDSLKGWLRPITSNEAAWIEFIRLASFDSDPPPTLKHVQRLRRIFSG